MFSDVLCRCPDLKFELKWVHLSMSCPKKASHVVVHVLKQGGEPCKDRYYSEENMSQHPEDKAVDKKEFRKMYLKTWNK